MTSGFSAPVFGAAGTTQGNERKFSLTTSWRYFKSDRHYVGPDYQGERDEEGSQVVNHVNMAEVSLRYNVDRRWSITTSIPYLMNERSNPLRNAAREVVARSETQATGLGDITVVGRRWMLNPETHPKTNWVLGFGVKLPTGDPGVEDTRTRLADDGSFTKTVETVDQSIQPGDGGLGAIIDLSWFYSVWKGRMTFYTQATYLFNPEEKNGVPTNRSRESEAIMSVPDQYMARLGASWSGAGWHGWSFGLGGRLEGVPVWDVIGGDEGFRRPGYSIAVEPWFSWTRGQNSVVASVPIAQYRNRTRSVPDRLTPGRHGDAAFADWVAMVSYSRRFGKVINKSDVPASTESRNAWDARPEFDLALCNDASFVEKMREFESTLQAMH